MRRLGPDTALLGESLAMCRLRALITRVGPSSLPVLVEGPTGSGKELVARAIHDASGRRGEMVAFNVCAIADTMFEDALFGHVRGAFTGAVHDGQGYLAQAHDGTAFFDEISGLPLAAQAKLLRAIETHEFRPVGARHDMKSEFRLVASTTESLEELCHRGAFRDDLRHRFGKVVLRVPSLAERRDDIPLLVMHFLRLSGATLVLAPRAMERLQSHTWQGNVRELRAVVEAVAVLTAGPRIDVEDVGDLLSDKSGARTQVRLDSEIERTVAELTKQRGDVYATAEALGVSPTTVYRRLRRARVAPALAREIRVASP